MVITGPPSTLDLKPGELVRVRSAREIFATLDEHGTLDGLPFMPEMVKYCGRTLPVDKRADKTCNGVGDRRRMHDTVHLTNLRCDGSAHGGCQAACLTFWKEAWLERVDSPSDGQQGELDTEEQGFLTGTLLPLTMKASSNGAAKPAEDASAQGPNYRCQATDIEEASHPLHDSELGQYVKDVRNWGLLKVLRGLAIEVIILTQRVSRKTLRISLGVKGWEIWPFFSGRHEKGETPSAKLDLQPGDMVRIKSKEEILETLDHTNHNRGLAFDIEMVPYCGRNARVKGRIERVIDERSGEMIQIRSDCIVLEGVVCKADYHKFCTRAIYPFWREIWLEKVD
jgi:hypothetical protein